MGNYKIIEKLSGGRQQSPNSNRLIFLDMIKGICALMVICSHLGALTDIPEVYSLFYGYIMLPSFFVVSGYLIKPKESLFQSLYTRIGKLLVLYVVLSYLGAFMNVSLIKSALKKPMILVDTFMETTESIIKGQTMWFVACLILIMVFLLIVIHITAGNLSVLVIVSLFIATMGYIFRLQGHMRPWSYDTAAFCQIFCVAGYVLKVKGQKILDRINLMNSIILIGFYLLLIIILYVSTETELLQINVALNEWGFLPITICMLLLGNFGIFALCKSINKGIFLPYVGRHSLLFFVFASHFASVSAKLLFWLVEITGMEMLRNGYVASVLITMSAALLMGVACIFIDVFIPFLNGEFQMPMKKFPSGRN